MTVALILGGAACVWDDARAALKWAKPDIVIAMNDMIPRWPGHIDHAVSLHPKNYPGWLDARRAAGRPDPGLVWSYRQAPRVQKITNDWRGSSGLFAVKVALVCMSMHGAILAGVPLDRSNHFVRDKPWTDAYAFFPGWADRKREIAPRVRSMSGWTRQQFGEPDAAWLAKMNALPPDVALLDLVEQSLISA